MPEKIGLSLPDKFLPLLTEKHRYKVFWGGRGGAKSESYARAALIKAAQKKLTVLCCREIQLSIADSMHRGLANVIKSCGLLDIYEIQRETIICRKTGSEFLFEGLYRNTNKIKSYNSIDICWLCEAQSMSEESLVDLFPTVRNPESEIWIEFNQRYADDPVYKRFVADPPADALVVPVNWRDNPFFPDVLAKERENDYRYRPWAAKQIWEFDLMGEGSAVYPGFDEKVHVKNFDLSELKRANVFMGFDPHSSYYPACTWMALIPHGSEFIRWVFAEWPRYATLNEYYHHLRTKSVYSGTYGDMAREFYSTEQTFAVDKVYGRFIDTRFARGSGAAAWSNKTEGIVLEFARKENGGLSFTCPPVTQIDIQRDRIRHLQEYNKFLKVSETNQPLFYVSPSCRNVLQSMRHHRFEEGSETESEKYKDFSDSIKICLAGMDGWRYRDPLKKAEESYSLHPANTYAREAGGWMGM